MMNKRLLSGALLALLLLSSSACGDAAGETVTTQNTETQHVTEAPVETEIPKLPASIEQIDMNGFELGIKHLNHFLHLVFRHDAYNYISFFVCKPPKII